MIRMRSLLNTALAVSMALSLTAPVFALDYSFTSKAPQDYYTSTSYEDICGSRYNYGGRSVADCGIPDLGYGRPGTVQTGVMERAVLPGLQQTVAAGTVIPETTVTTPGIPSYTSVQGMAYADGSIGTLNIPKLGISVKVWEGETDASMAKGVAHYSSTSAWNGNLGLCGHNRGAKYNIGTIKDLAAGDLITYTTVYGTRTYEVTMVKVISYTDWSYLQPTADNRITLTTCVENQPTQRICVQAVEKSTRK